MITCRPPTSSATWPGVKARLVQQGEVLSPDSFLPSAQGEHTNISTLSKVRLVIIGQQLFDYVPTPRSAAGTGGGWCFARWHPARGTTAADGTEGRLVSLPVADDRRQIDGTPEPR